MISTSQNVDPNAKCNGVRIVGVETYSWPMGRRYDLCQSYLQEGLRYNMGEQGADFRVRSLSRFPALLRQLRRLRDSSALERLPASRFLHEAINYSGGLIGGRCLPPSGTFVPSVGQYVFHLSDGQTHRICIDVHDSGDIRGEELLDCHDLYFKANFWRDRSYPAKVKPFFNCNPIVLPYLSTLKALRSSRTDYDFCFVLRVWGGTDEVQGIEHNIRLLEAAAKVPGRKLLIAYLVAGDTNALSRRLRGQGITTTTCSIALHDLWTVAATSRLNIIRLGMHACIPWRMTDLLAMGCCPVLDQRPKTIWPAPLDEETHYLSLGADTPPDRWLAEDSAYAAIPDKLAQFVQNTEHSLEIRANCAAYFDDHFAPRAVARRLCTVVQAESIGRSTNGT